MTRPLFTTSGRPMTGHLQRALDDLPAGLRKHVIQAFLEKPEGESLTPIYRAVALELQLQGLREQEALAGIADGLRADIPAGPPLPLAEGGTCWFDPDTGTFSDTPPDAGQASHDLGN